jgi:hypothetical protein
MDNPTIEQSLASKLRLISLELVSLNKVMGANVEKKVLLAGSNTQFFPSIYPRYEDMWNNVSFTYILDSSQLNYHILLLETGVWHIDNPRIAGMLRIYTSGLPNWFTIYASKYPELSDNPLWREGYRLARKIATMAGETSSLLRELIERISETSSESVMNTITLALAAQVMGHLNQ